MCGAGEGMSAMASAVKRGETEAFCGGVRGVAGAVQALAEAAAQAAYLAAVADASSVAGRAGLVDQAQFARAALAIDTACAALADPAGDQHQVPSYANTTSTKSSLEAFKSIRVVRRCCRRRR